MPKFKNIRIKMKNGKTRLQRVQVLASGKYKFVKNIGKSRAKSKSKSPKKASNRKRSNNPKRSVYRTAKGKFFKNLGLAGFVEDLAWGYVGMSMLGSSASGLATTRVIQGIQGHALNRRGKARLIYGLIDLIDLWLLGQYKLPQFNIPLLEAWK